MTVLLPFVKLFRRHLWTLLLGGALGLVTLFSSIGLLTLSGWFITASGLAGLGLIATFEIFRPGAGVRFFALTRTVGRYFERVVTHDATFRILAELRVWLFDRMIPLAPGKVARMRSGDVLNRVTADIDALDNLYLRVLAPSAIALLLGAGFVAFLAIWSVPIAVAVGIALLLAGVGVPLATGRLGATTGKAIVERTEGLRIGSVDALQGLAEIAVFRAGARAAARIRSDSDGLIAAQRRMARVGGLGSGLSLLIAQTAVLATLVIGLQQLAAGQASGAVLAMMVLGVMAAFELTAPLPLAFQYLGRTKAAAGRLLDIARAKPTVVDPDRPRDLPARGAITLDRVTYRYQPERGPVLEGLSLTVGEGEHVAVIGASGSGKSTLATLLLRLADPLDGAIRLGDVDIRDVSQAELHRRIGYLSQRSELFDATIADNLRIADPHADAQHLRAALAQAQLGAFVDALPDGLDTWIGEGGTRLSGGQARRIALARVILKDAPILLLDEPTEGLDAETETMVLQALRRFAEDRSVILITHREAGLAAMDRVVRLEAGRLAESASRAGASDPAAAPAPPIEKA